MSLLAILISLALEKFLPTLSGLRSLNWISHYQQWVQTRLTKQPKWQGIPSLLIIILLPVIGTAAIQYYLNDLLALFSFLFSIVVLTYCLGPEDEHRRTKNYLDAIEDENRSDTDNIQTNLTGILHAGGITSDTETMDEETRINRLIESVLIITHDRMLAILFWFVILGPMGAVLYRLTLALFQNINQHEPQAIKIDTESQTESQTENSHTDEFDPDFDPDFDNAVRQLHHLLSWIPSHLTALSYAVMGSFVHALNVWKDGRKEGSATAPDKDQQERRNTFESTNTSANRDLLLRVGLASLQFNTNPPQDNTAVRETLGLCGRSLIAWITILAIMTLAGWAS